MQWLVWMYSIFIPEHEAGRESVIEILNKLAAQIKRTQDPATGVWYQVIDRSGDEGELSGILLFYHVCIYSVESVT